MPLSCENTGRTDNAQDQAHQVLCKADRAAILPCVIQRTLCSDSGTDSRFPLDKYRIAILFAPTATPSLRALLLLVLMGLSEDVLEYLFWAKSAEEDAWLRDDIAIAIRTVALASEGVQHADVCATYEVLGLHPNEVWPRIVERRKAVLGSLYDSWYGVSVPVAAGLFPPDQRELPPETVAGQDRGRTTGEAVTHLQPSQSSPALASEVVKKPSSSVLPQKERGAAA